MALVRREAVTAHWDTEARVWVADCADVPGLVAEADTLDALATKLEHLIPELLELNSVELRRPAIDLVATRSLQLAR